MFSSQSKIKASLAAIVVLAISIAGARADEPTPAALNYANQILVDVGIKPSLDMMVPEMLSGLDRNITATRPELKNSCGRRWWPSSPNSSSPSKASSRNRRSFSQAG